MAYTLCDNPKGKKHCIHFDMPEGNCRYVKAGCKLKDEEKLQFKLNLNLKLERDTISSEQALADYIDTMVLWSYLYGYIPEWGVPISELKSDIEDFKLLREG